MITRWEQGNDDNYHNYVVDGVFSAYVYPICNVWCVHIFAIYSNGGSSTYHATLEEAKAVAVALLAMNGGK